MAATKPDEELAHVREAVGADLDTVLVYNLLRTHSYLAPVVDADLRSRRLTAAQFNALLVLRAAGDEGLKMSEIGSRLVVTRANVTGLVDRLEREGLATRCPGTDRRSTLVRLAPAGKALLAEACPPHAEALAGLTGCFSAEEKRTLIALLTKLRRELRRRRQEGD